jgi:hypothetical protein
MPWRRMGSGGIGSRILDLGTRCVFSSRPGRFTPGEMAPGIHCIGVWVGPGADLDAVEKINKCLAPAGNRTAAV